MTLCLLIGVVKVKKKSLNSLLYLSAVLLHLPHPSILLLNVLISSEKSSLPVLLSVTPHSNGRLSPWCGVSCSPPSLGLQESQDALYIADRERSCVLSRVLTLQ